MADQAENPILAIVGLLEGRHFDALGRSLTLTGLACQSAKSWPRLACLTKSGMKMEDPVAKLWLKDLGLARIGGRHWLRNRSRHWASGVGK